jgi:hypothetical protein
MIKRNAKDLCPLQEIDRFETNLLGLAPFLWCMIISLLITYISLVITSSTLVKVTVGFGRLFPLQLVDFFMFFRCSSKDLGCIRPRDSIRRVT